MLDRQLWQGVQVEDAPGTALRTGTWNCDKVRLPATDHEDQDRILPADDVADQVVPEDVQAFDQAQESGQAAHVCD